MTRRSRWLALAAIGVAVACSSQSPEPGTLSVRLQDPNAALDGAILFTLTGPSVPTSPAGVAGDTLWGGPFSGTTNKFVLTGTIQSGVVLTFGVPDVNAANQYAATMNQVAASGDYSLRSLSSYSLTVTR
jgi:hypothetical protein